MPVWEPIAELAENVRSGKVTARSLVEKSLKIIEEREAYHAILAVIKEGALARADEIDSQVKNGKNPGKLAGVPFIAKDNFLVFGAETTAASNILKGFDAPYQSTAINRLEAEGAICVAKANLDAFAHGSSTENSDFMTTLNPFDKTRIPGGSSGGSAAAVALDMAPFALGTDTGGSIRLPASFCGVVGYKPTYGLISRSGVVAMGSSLDVIGPLTKTINDAAIVTEVMAGKDVLDATTIERDKAPYDSLQAVDLSGLKVGVIKEFMADGLEDGVRVQINKSIDFLKQNGAEIIEVSLPTSHLGLAVYYVLCPAEVSSNLSRYDGQRFGYSAEDAKNLDESYGLSRSRGFGDEAKRRIMIGTYVLSSGFYDAYYQKAQLVRTKIIQEFDKAFDDCDFLIGPTASATAFKVGENTQDPLKMYLMDVMTVTSNLIGAPTVSLPVGQSAGLPVGLQIIGPQNADKRLLEFAQSLEGKIS